MTHQNPSTPTPFVAAVCFFLIRPLVQMMSNGLTYTFSRFNDYRGFFWFYSGVSVWRLHPDARHTPILNESMIAGMLGGIKPPQLLIIGHRLAWRSWRLQAVYVNPDQLLNHLNDRVSLVKSAGHTDPTVQLLYWGGLFGVGGFEPSPLRGKDYVCIGLLLKWDFPLTTTGVSDGVWRFVWGGWKHWKASYPKWIKRAFHHSSIVMNKEMHVDTILGWKGQSENHDNHRGEGTEA